MAGRRGRDPAKERHWRRLVRRWEQSGLSVREFCDWQSLSEPSFYGWRRELAGRDPDPVCREAKAARRVTPAEQFVPVRVLSDEPAAFGSVPVVEVHLPSGVRLRVPAGFDRRTLADVLAALETQPC
jgi:hypothetical protein